LSAAQFKSWKA